MGALSRRVKPGHPGYWAAVLQRLSGLLLALFLPAHFALLGAGLHSTEGLDEALAWTRSPLVRVAEAGLVTALALHVAGGVRLLLLEFLGWHAIQKSLFSLACGLATATGLLFALNNF